MLIWGLVGCSFLSTQCLAFCVSYRRSMSGVSNSSTTRSSPTLIAGVKDTRRILISSNWRRQLSCTRSKRRRRTSKYMYHRPTTVPPISCPPNAAHECPSSPKKACIAFPKRVVEFEDSGASGATAKTSVQYPMDQFV